MPALTCDVLVVGGGPAGSTCAWRLVEAGFDVILMDKHAFPRDKVCAGWITPPVLASLRLDVDDYGRGRVLQPIRGFRTGLIGAPPVDTDYGEVVSFAVRRCEFDDYLLRRSGAGLRLDEPLTSLVREGNGFRANGSIVTPMVIGAGGHFCPVARSMRGPERETGAIVAAQELEFRLAPDEVATNRIGPDRVQFYFCPDLRGYGWCFTKGDYLNVGLGREDSHGLAEHVDRFCDWLQQSGRIPRELPERFRGHAYLLYPTSLRRPADANTLLVGDAAGLAHGRSGEGIRTAVESALIAADVVIGAAGDYRLEQIASYSARLARLYGPRGVRDAAAWLPARVREMLGAKLLATRWFSRRIVLDRWFLRTNEPRVLAA